MTMPETSRGAHLAKGESQPSSTHPIPFCFRGITQSYITDEDVLSDDDGTIVDDVETSRADNNDTVGTFSVTWHGEENGDNTVDDAGAPPSHSAHQMQSALVNDIDCDAHCQDHRACYRSSLTEPNFYSTATNQDNLGRLDAAVGVHNATTGVAQSINASEVVIGEPPLLDIAIDQMDRLRVVIDDNFSDLVHTVQVADSAADRLYCVLHIYPAGVTGDDSIVILVERRHMNLETANRHAINATARAHSPIPSKFTENFEVVPVPATGHPIESFWAVSLVPGRTLVRQSAYGEVWVTSAMTEDVARESLKYHDPWGILAVIKESEAPAFANFVGDMSTEKLSRSWFPARALTDDCGRLICDEYERCAGAD